MWNDISGRDSMLKSKATEYLRNQNVSDQRKQKDLYEKWQTNVYNKISTQLDRLINPHDRSFTQSLSGSKAVEFKLPDDNPVVVGIDRKNDPCKTDLHHVYEEEKFRRKMELVTGTIDPNTPQYIEQLHPYTVGYEISEFKNPWRAR